MDSRVTFKSLCAQTIGLDLALGRAPLSNPRFAVKSAVPVAYFTNEDRERLFHARMRWLTMNTGPVSGFYPFIRSGITFDTPAGRDSIISTIKSCGARVVVFDPGRSFSALFDKGPADLSPVTDFLRRIQNETCAKSILIVHHDVKPPSCSLKWRTTSTRAASRPWETITWSRLSRRIDPIILSTNGFGHGERGAVRTCSMPRPSTRRFAG